MPGVGIGSTDYRISSILAAPAGLEGRDRSEDIMLPEGSRFAGAGTASTFRYGRQFAGARTRHSEAAFADRKAPPLRTRTTESANEQILARANMDPTVGRFSPLSVVNRDHNGNAAGHHEIRSVLPASD